MLKMESNKGGAHITIEVDGIAELLTDMLIGVRGIMDSLRDEPEWSEDDERFMRMSLKEIFVPCVLAKTEEDAKNIVMSAILTKIIREAFDGESEHQQD